MLARPDMPLHTNASETDIRDYVKVRKISGGPRSDLGRQCRDTFASLKKTRRKLGVSFSAYLTDRLNNAGKVPPSPTSYASAPHDTDHQFLRSYHLVCQQPKNKVSAYSLRVPPEGGPTVAPAMPMVLDERTFQFTRGAKGGLAIGRRLAGAAFRAAQSDSCRRGWAREDGGSGDG